MGRLFGTDGVRGVANQTLTRELAMDIGAAAAMVLSGINARRRPVFVIGMDTRISSDMLALSAASGLCSVGADVIMLGTVPTPAVAFLVGRASSGHRQLSTLLLPTPELPVKAVSFPCSSRRNSWMPLPVTALVLITRKPVWR